MDLPRRPPQRQSRAFVLTHLLTLGSRGKSRMQMRSNASTRKYLRERIEPLDRGGSWEERGWRWRWVGIGIAMHIKSADEEREREREREREKGIYELG